MNAAAFASTSRQAAFQLRFASLFHQGRGYAFPCDSAGRVNLNALSERSRNNYFYARAVVGRDLATPAVQGSKSDPIDRLADVLLRCPCRQDSYRWDLHPTRHATSRP